MKTLIYKLVIFLFFISSCRNKLDTEFIYYHNGGIEYKREYFNKQSGDFVEYYYSTTGNLLTKCYYKNNKLDGKLYVYNDDTLKMIKTYRADSIYGVSKVFSKVNNQLISIEYLFINGKKVVYKQFLSNKDKTWFAFNNYFMLDNDIAKGNGYLVWNINNDISIEKSHYYDVDATDTISEDDLFNACVTFIDENNWNIRLELGEMDENLIFIDSPIIYEGLNKLDISITPAKKGNNLLMGKLYVSLDSLPSSERSTYEEEYIFYHEYYVKDKEH